ncbi:hypothetical protein N7533_003099 [Penicillium manginii]|uniref:uncharacterized protein n=1 Tax=Penicillium manginii TaxID=203109 RepID=UPI0025499D03|nr:uncharacterized protein N7533_003099 [Penicillium manginii]KAJ5764418.1 hypothetical protein N7533_003099 [Penicillium manginii]
MTPKGSRKRVKPSPSGADSPSPAAPRNAGRDRSDSQPSGRASWYPGSWSTVSRTSKAAPVTEVARESISVAQNVASGIAESTTSLLDNPRHSRHPSFQLTKKAGNSTRSLPADVTTTRLNIASDGTASTTALNNIATSTPTGASTPNKEASGEGPGKPAEKATSDHQHDITTQAEPPTSHAEETTSTEQASGWLSWIYRPIPTEKDTADGPEPAEATQEQPDKAGPDPAAQQTNESGNQQEPEPEPEHAPDQSINTPQASPNAHKRSWLQMWYGSAPSTRPAEPPTELAQGSQSHTTNPSNEDVDMAPKDLPESSSQVNSNEQPQPPAGATKASGWSFWSKEPSKGAEPSKPQEVEAVEATLDQNTPPRPTSLGPSPDSHVNITKKGSLKVKLTKDGQVKDGAVPVVETTSANTIAPTEPQPADTSASKQLQKILPNQAESCITAKGQSTGTLLVSRNPPRIKRALAIGVHGYFPAPVIRSVLGQPTGTSIRFSNMAAEAITKWTADHGYSCEVEKIALEGEGRIADRVDLLWKLLLNWMEEIRKADFILVACHSQGVPVSIMLVAKLISFGCLDASRVGICAMAGVNMGPFSSYRSRWISGSAGELFEFELPSSKVSKDYEAALQCALDFGVRISYVGSIDDQLVSLESSLFSPIAHPYIYRSVFVDGRVHAPSFLSHLVGFALKLRNLGVPDHGLIRELSGPLAGSLYTGDGHSRLYDDEVVYYMAIQFALETSSVPDATLNIKRSTSPLVPANPYILPFAMRGLLEEEHVRRQLHDETMELLRQFDDWKPSSKVLKDVKFRLEGIRSKL